MTKLIPVLLVCGLFVGCCFAPALKVLPWNDHPADVVVPELNKRHLHGAFFVIISKPTRSDDWRKAQFAGAQGWPSFRESAILSRTLFVHTPKFRRLPLNIRKGKHYQ